MTAPARRPDGRRERTRKALIEAGRALFAKRPSDAVSIDEIVDAAGVAKGSFYNHFPDKEALVREIARLARVELEAAIGRVNLGVEDPAARVVRAFCAAVRFAVDDPADARTLTRLFSGADALADLHPDTPDCVERLDAFLIDRVPAAGANATYARQAIRDRLVEHKAYIAAHGEDMPTVKDWQWTD